jgi:hypothetical protein
MKITNQEKHKTVDMYPRGRQWGAPLIRATSSIDSGPDLKFADGGRPGLIQKRNGCVAMQGHTRWWLWSGEEQPRSNVSKQWQELPKKLRHGTFFSILQNGLCFNQYSRVLLFIYFKCSVEIFFTKLADQRCWLGRQGC